MSEFVPVSRAVIIADRSLEAELVEAFVKLGAKGWTSVYCNGRGGNVAFDDPFVEPDRSRVRIEILASKETAEAILRHVEDPPYGLRRVIAYMDLVQASDRRKY